MSDADHIDIVFDGPPDQKPPRFVEVENGRGRSIGLGEWVQRPDSYWALRIDRKAMASVAGDLNPGIQDTINEIGRFMHELARTMGVDIDDTVEIAEMSRRLIKAAKAWEPLRVEFAKPQFLTHSHEPLRDGGRRAAVNFTFSGPDGSERAVALHDAICKAASQVNR